MDDFVHLHVHDEYSMLDGAASTPKLIQRVAELGQTAIAQTNHGNLFGSYTFHKECVANHVTPIIGLEAYVSPGRRDVRSKVLWGTPEQKREDISGGGAYTHLTLLARNEAGLRNLFKLSTESYASGFYSKPRIDLELLSSLSEGLFIGSGCLSGELLTRLSLGQEREADQYVLQMKEMFGDAFFIEVMDHNFDRESSHLEELFQLGRKYAVKCVATNDSHYINAEDSILHDAMLCLQTFSKLDDPKRMSFDGSGYYIKSRLEMEALALPKESLDNTLWVAEQVESYGDIFKHKTRMPSSGYPDDKVELHKRLVIFLEGKSETYRDRGMSEFKTICSLGFAPYFNVLSDICRWARDSKIRVGPGRGSAGGSLVAYALGITQLDPISLDLSFERFLNADRVSPPDIDLDIDDAHRDELISYVRSTYGEDYCASIITIGTIGAKKALRDSARVLGRPFEVGTRLTWSLPRAEFGRMPSLSEANMSKVEDRDAFDLACKLEGLARNSGVHAAGFVISSERLVDVVPLFRPDAGKGQQGIAWDGKAVEALGLTKYDFLGLKNLGIIDDALLLLRDKVRGDSFSELPVRLEDFNDAKTFSLLQRGETTGVFQLDSPGMQRLLTLLRPNVLGDIAAVLALYRPGPMGVGAHTEYAKRKNGQAQVLYPHPEYAGKLDKILGPTFGLLVYQEQVMSTLVTVAGYTATQADLVRRAMGKKDRALLAAEYDRFKSGALANGYSEEAIQTLWETLVPFADYSFNKSHAYGYGIISYWTAYLKAHHPREYMCSLLAREDDTDKIAEYAAEIRRIGIRILSPSVNSGLGWSVDGDDVRYGLTSIKGVGEKVAVPLVRNSPYSGWADFLRRAPKTALNSGVVRALIQAGAFDSLSEAEGFREALLETYEQHLLEADLERKELKKGELGFGARRYLTTTTKPNYAQRAAGELETLGVELSAAPLVYRAPTDLSASGWDFVRRLHSSGLGSSPLTVLCGPWRFETGLTVDQQGFDRGVTALGWVLLSG